MIHNSTRPRRPRAVTKSELEKENRLLRRKLRIISRATNGTTPEEVIKEMLVASRITPAERGQQKRSKRVAILERDRYRCYMCGREFLADQLTIDHIIPTSRGGTREEWNEKAACKECNELKGNDLLRELIDKARQK